ncbi:hypothetical protein [Streptomyces sp. NBC_00006]
MIWSFPAADPARGGAAVAGDRCWVAGDGVFHNP